MKITSGLIYKPLWKSRKRYILLYGGRGAGRSYETSQKIAAKLIQTQRPFRGAIMRSVSTDIRHSIWQEILDRVKGWDLERGINIVDTMMEMSVGKNSLHAHGFKKSSSERTAKLKSLANYTDAFIEEAEEVGEGEFQQLDDSLRASGSQIYLLFNTPPKSNWIVKRWFDTVPSERKGFYELKPKSDEIEAIFGTHNENNFLAREVHERYENYKSTKPQYYWQMIAGLCPETLMGKIYDGWKEIPDIPHEARLLGYGLDFGFDPDPAALIAIYYYNGGYIADEKLYSKKLVNDQLAMNIKLHPEAVVIADAAEPKSIEELKRHGINILPCSKGSDSVKYGIKHVQGLKMSYTSGSPNIRREYESYAWKVDKDGNETKMEDPKCDNHAMSAIRYFLSETVKANADPEASKRNKDLQDSKARATRNKLMQSTR